MPFFFIEQVALIKYKYHGHAIGLGGSQETVDEGGRCLGLADGDDQQSLIDVGCKDMTLLGEVNAFADDVVLTVLNLRNKTSPTPARREWSLDGHAVTHGYRISAANAPQTEISLDFTIKQLAIVTKDGVPASCILND